MQWQEASTLVDGLRIRFWESGASDALPVLCLHGWASSGRMWLSLPNHLNSDVHLVAPDLPGHGASTKPEARWYSIPNFRKVVQDLSAQLGLDRPLLLGHSMGGSIALNAVTDQAEFARAAVLVNPVIEGKDLPFLTAHGSRMYGAALKLGRVVWPPVSRLLHRLPDFLYRNDKGRSRRVHRDLADTTADSALGSIQAVYNHGLDASIVRVEVPVLVVVGSGDTTVPPEQGRRAARAIDTAHLIELDTGHHILDHDPSALAGILDRFLAEQVLI